MLHIYYIVIHILVRYYIDSCIRKTLSLCSMYTRSKHTLNNIQIFVSVLQGDHWDKWEANDARGNLAQSPVTQLPGQLPGTMFFFGLPTISMFSGGCWKMKEFRCNSPKKQQFLQVFFVKKHFLLNESGDSPDLIPAFDISAESK